MRISEAKKCIKAIYLKTDAVIALISERGVGKTSAFQQAAEELGIGYIGLYAAALEGPDFMGLPEKNGKHQITQYLPPQFLPTEQAVMAGQCPEKGILVLEEINRVPSDTISVLYPLLLEKKLNGHQMAKGWAIGVTMNPDKLNYMVNALDDAMLDRFIAIEITPNIEDYLEYSQLNAPNEAVLSFLKKMPEMLLVVKSNGESSVFSKSPTPRGWTQVQLILNQSELEKSLLKELVSGIVGPQASASFFNYMSQQMPQIPDADMILNHYIEVRMDVITLIEKRQMEWIHYLIKECIRKIEYEFEAANQQQLETYSENLEDFVKDLPDEFQLFYFKHLIQSLPNKHQVLTKSSETFEKISGKIIDFAYEM